MLLEEVGNTQGDGRRGPAHDTTNNNGNNDNSNSNGNNNSSSSSSNNNSNNNNSNHEQLAHEVQIENHKPADIVWFTCPSPSI